MSFSKFIFCDKGLKSHNEKIGGNKGLIKSSILKFDKKEGRIL